MIVTRGMINIEVQKMLRKGMYFKTIFNRNLYIFEKFISCNNNENCECMGRVLCYMKHLEICPYIQKYNVSYNDNFKLYEVCLGQGNYSAITVIYDDDFINESEFTI